MKKDNSKWHGVGKRIYEVFILVPASIGALVLIELIGVSALLLGYKPSPRDQQGMVEITEKI